MKITGTKKLLIIFFALVCALTAGLGLIISRSSLSVHAYDGTQAEDLLLTGGTSADAEAEDGALSEPEYDERFDEGVIKESADILGVNPNLVNLYCHVLGNDARDLLAYLVENQEKIDAAANTDIDYDKDRDGVLTEEQAKAMEEAQSAGQQEISELFDDVLLFQQAYINGEVEVSEEEDWFIPPDEVGSYVTYYYWYAIGYSNNATAGIVKIYKEATTAGTGSAVSGADGMWVDITSEFETTANLHIPSTSDLTKTVTGSTATSQYGTYEMIYDASVSKTLGYYNRYGGTDKALTSGIWNFHSTLFYQVGYYKEITLEPGQRLLMTYYMHQNVGTNGSSSSGTTYTTSSSLRLCMYGHYGVGYNENMSGYTTAANSASTHWQKVSWVGGNNPNYGLTSVCIVDGDAPTGSVYYIGRGINSASTGNNGTQGPRRYTWNITNTNIYGNYGTAMTAAYYNKSSQSWTYWVGIKRSDPAKPTLVNDVIDSDTSYTADTKTAKYKGEPVTLAVNPDYGAALLNWSAATNQSFTQPDETVTLKSRSQHGIESTSVTSYKASDIVVESSTSGTHYIKFESATGRWADGSTTPAIFKLVIQEQYTTRPSLQGGAGVQANGTDKILNYTGDYLTISFINADPKFVGYSAPGMEFDSWDNNVLTLKQKERGTYSITIFLTNPAGCFWSDTKTNESKTFTFQIKEMLISQPTVTAWPTGTGTSHTATECVVDYDGEYKYLKLAPALQEQLIIVAAGVEYDFTDEDGDGIKETCVFKVKESGTQTITIMPDSGYLWLNKTSTAISFKITVNAVPLDFPTLAPGQGAVNNAITVPFNPDKNFKATLIIENIPQDAIVYTTAMAEDSWLPVGETEASDDPRKNTVLTLSQTQVNKYVVTFALANTNYRWKDSGSSPPSFSLTITPFKLTKPYINETLPDGYSGGYIDGDTKTIYFNVDDPLQPSTPKSDRYFKLFVGGFIAGQAGFGLDAGQITIKYTKNEVVSTDGLEEVWTDVGTDYWSSTPNLTLNALKAGNYLIDITPTHNYVWDDGTNDMVTFKFVISYVTHETLQLYVKYSGGSGWIASNTSGSEDYDGTEKLFRIGNESIATEFFVPSDMTCALVDQDDVALTDSNYYLKAGVVSKYSYLDGFTMRLVQNGDSTVIECSAVNAGTYLIKLSLSDENTVWRGGQTADIYYTFTVTAKSVETPTIIAAECSGGQDLKVYDSSFQNFIEAGYDGGDVQMVIKVENALSVDYTPIFELVFDPDGNDNDNDPDLDPSVTNGKGIWQISWGAGEDGIDRLIIRARNVGHHKVILRVIDTNYRFGNDVGSEILFRIEIDYAEVDDIVFSYSLGDDETLSVIGGHNSTKMVNYEVETQQHITVTRSSDEFANTKFETQFTFDITYDRPEYEFKSSSYTDSSLVIDFEDANVYYVHIYLTSNYRWKTNQEIGAPLNLIFTIAPKIVSIPLIEDEGELNDDGTPAATINMSLREKTVVYDSNKTQSISILFGDDYKAFEVEPVQTSAYLNWEFTNVSIANDKKVRFTAKSAGSYYVYIKLSNSNNYAWFEGETAAYLLNITPRSIAVPDAFYIALDDIGTNNTLHTVTTDIKNGTRGSLITADPNGDYKTTHTYTGKNQYVYLFGYAIENREVNITVSVDTPNLSDPNNTSFSSNVASVGGLICGQYIEAKYVNVYTITVEFVLNEFNTPNCHWSGVTIGADTQPRIFIFEIEKLGIELPTLDASPNTENPTVPVFVDNELEWHFTYSGKENDPDFTLGVEKCLSMSPIFFMNYNGNSVKFNHDDTLDYLTIWIEGYATVNGVYSLTVVIDTNNEYWINPIDPTDISDVDDKLIKLVIDQLGIDAPKILATPTSDSNRGGATYDTTDWLYKMYTYDGNAWPDAMTVTGIKYDVMAYSLSDSTVSAYKDGNNDLVVGTTNPNSGTYSIIFTLVDSINLKWAGTVNDVSPISYDLIIDPIRIDKPVFDDSDLTIFNSVDTYSFNTVVNADGSTTNELNVIFWKDTVAGSLTLNQGILQYIIIKNFVPSEEIMMYQVISSAFDDSIGKYILGGGTDYNALKFGSFNAGTYQVKITPTQNIGWKETDASGNVIYSDGYIIFSLKIDKKEYVDPTIYDPDANANPPVVTVTNTATGYQREVTYILDTWQTMEIRGIDPNLLYLGETTSSLPSTAIDGEMKLVSHTTTDYVFEAKQAGTYTVTFYLYQFANERLTFADVDKIVFTFVIKKLEIEKPVFDTDAALLLTDESAKANTFSAVYDANYHGALVLNVLGEGYMTYQPKTDYLGDFGYSATPTATSELTPATYLTIADIFNSATKTTKVDALFANGTTLVADQLNRLNFILLDAKETGTYQLTFTLVDTANVQWADGTNGTVTVTFTIVKKQLNAPNYNGVTSQAYTGKPLTFEIKDVYGVAAKAYTPTAYTGLEYEVFEVISTPSVKATIEATSLDITKNVLTLTATEIGTYTVKIRIKETNHFEWKLTTLTEKSFTFVITKGSITPTIEFSNPKLATGAADTATEADFLAGNFEWPKSSSVTAKITFTNFSVNTSGKIEIDESLGFEIYYVNTSEPTVKLCLDAVTPSVDAADLFANPALLTAAGTTVSSLNPQWSLIVTATGSSFEYELVYTFTIIPDSQKHPVDANNVRYIPMGNYSLQVDQSGISTTYTVGSAAKAFKVNADRAPFDTQSVFDNIVWQRYLVSDPDTILETYAIGNVYLADGVTLLDHWSNMKSADEIVLPFLEDNDSYGFKFSLDTTGMNGEPDVQLALQSWEVNWDGIYGGSAIAKYAGSYSVSVTITAKDAKSFAFKTTTYTLYYKISKILYDLDGLEWYYTDASGNDVVYPSDGTTPFVYDGKSHSIRIDASDSVWAKLPGLTVSYDVAGYDLNSQSSAKYDKNSAFDPTKNYYTVVKFSTSNPNYEVPDMTDDTTYKINGVSGVAFANWTKVWGIDKAVITDGWVSVMSSDGTATLSIPELAENGGKVDYKFYIDDGSSPATEVTAFDYNTTPNYFVVATLKSDPLHPEVDYATNYVLNINGVTLSGNPNAVASDGPEPNSKSFVLAPGNYISVKVEITQGNVDTQLTGSSLDTDPTSNVFKYDGNQLIANVTVLMPSTGVTVIDPVGNPNGNLLVTYYNTANKFRTIDPPTEPGHYLVKVQLLNLPADGKEYVLVETEFYFDIEKGDFDDSKVYWQYEHTDDDGNKTTAKFDPKQGANGLWVIEQIVDIDGNDITVLPDGTDRKGMAIDFVYDGKDHTVKLVSDDKNLLVTTKNMAQTEAGKFVVADKTAAMATFSYNGKLWNDPTFIQSEMEWEIQKAVIDLTQMSWDYTNDYVYTLSGGEEKKFTVTMKDIPGLLKTFVTYKTYNLDVLDENGDPTLLDTHVLSKAGHYMTEFIYEDFDQDEKLKKNYELSVWPVTLPQQLCWEIGVREIEIPVSNGTWTTFDGYEHDLISSINIFNEWEEYLTVSIEYDDGANGFKSYDGTLEFGNALFASHAGTYKFTFSIIEGINTVNSNDPTKNQINVVFDLVSSTTLDDQSTSIIIAKATMLAGSWNQNAEASTVILSGSYVNYDVIDYKFTLPDGTTPVDIAEVASSNGAQYIIWAYVKDDYKYDIDLSPSTPNYTFTTLTLSDDPNDQVIVVRVPYIVGYKVNGVQHDFTYEEWKQLMLDDPDFFASLGINVNTIDENFDWIPYLGYASDEEEQKAMDEMSDEEKADYLANKASIAIQLAEYKARVRVGLTFTGNTIEFVINDWDYYSQYLDIWQGNLVRSDAGDYSITLMFKKTTSDPPLCWSFVDSDNDGVIDSVDRSPVTLNFRIAFRMLKVPVIKDQTYTGSELNVLTASLGDDYDEWWAECQEFVDIVGATGTVVGGYTLQLKIKDLYLNTIHWDNGTAKGQPGTYTIKWKVLPIYIPIPSLDTSKSIVYDGGAHSVFEIFTGYNGGELSKDLQMLMQLAQISGDRGVNAGDYDARFMLPDTNYAWKTDTGDVNESTLIQFPWKIQRKVLDMSKLEWNYDEDNPFQYTIENGEAQPHTIELLGLPEELKELITYLTDDVIGNEKSAMGTYTTVVYFSQGSVDVNNYELANAPADFLSKYKDPDGNGYLAITWKIIERRFKVPTNAEVTFDGTVRELLSLFGFEDGWENYIDATIEYKELGASDKDYVSYTDMAIRDALLNYSPFNAFYLGNYRVEFTIKDGLNTATSNCVVWINGGNVELGKQTATLTINPLELTITGWKDNGDYNYTIITQSGVYESLSDESKDIFEYVYRDQATGEIVTVDDIKNRGAGIMYTVEFVIKEGNYYATNTGVKIGCDGTTNPFEFANLDFPGNPNAQDSVLFWLPLPTVTMLSDDNTFSGVDKEWRIDDWDNYLFSETYPTFADEVFHNHGVDITNYVSYIIPAEQYASSVDTSDGLITLKAAGTYEIVLRLLPNVNLSWYDPAKYYFDTATMQLKNVGTNTVVTNTDSLINRYAQKIEITIEKADVKKITDEILLAFTSMIPELEYTGKEYDLTELDELKAQFKNLTDTYGSLITFEGYKGTNAGDYTMYIKLTDPNSSFWNLGITETVQINSKSYEDYNADYEIRYVNGVVKYAKADGTEYDGKYTIANLAYSMVKAISAYVDMTGLLDENGMPIDSNVKYVVDANGKPIRYSLVDGKYVEDPEGTIIAKYSLNADGSIVEIPEMVDGKPVIDQENSVVTITRTKTSTDPYEIQWSITTSSKAAPTLNPNVTLTYTGSEQFAEKALSGFDASVMEIVDGASATNYGEYTAKIRIKDENYRWRDGIADEDGFVYVTWKIEKATVDLSNVTWKFTDGTNNYANGAGMIYTRINGKAVVYWAELDNLPEALKGSIRYTTNGLLGACAGTDAGKYTTSFEIIDPYGNFNTIVIPETLATEVTWNIERRILQAPTLTTQQLIFDDEVHDLLAELNLQEDWAEYFTITVMYAKNFTTFEVYEGYNGNPFDAYGAGAYRFMFTIKAGINSSTDNPCVVWLKNAVEVQPDEGTEEDTTEQTPGEDSVTDVETNVPETRIAVKEVIASATQDGQSTVREITVSDTSECVSAVDTVTQQICDRLRKLTYGAQIHLQSAKKYLR